MLENKLGALAEALVECLCEQQALRAVGGLRASSRSKGLVSKEVARNETLPLDSKCSAAA